MSRFLPQFFIILFFSLGMSSGVFAQYEGDDVYDPFADYSEFEENSQEEADINFFRNGRFFNFGFLFGGRMFNKGMAQHIEANLSPGLTLTYFFNIRFALQFTYSYSSHLFGPIVDPAQPIPFEGNVSFTHIAFDAKYYFNTANVTRGLAFLNPYIIGGFSQNQRTFSAVDQLFVAKDDGAGIEAGIGIEIPVSRKEIFIGAQVTYVYVDFSTENRPVVRDPDVFLDGDMMQAYFILGFNFL